MTIDPTTLTARETYHEVGRPCPLTGEPIPGNIAYTDHDRPGAPNSCAACNRPLNPTTSLRAIERRRRQEDEA